MTKFKFRVWDKEEKHMHYMPAAELYEKFFWRADGVLCDVLYDPEYSDPEPVDDKYEVSISTGLLDCNGKEIFEGDVLSVEADQNDNGDTAWLYVVKFFDGTFWAVSLDDDKEYELIIEVVEWNKCRVVTNIFEEPDILG